jgi:predicted metal-binding protein
MKKLLRRINALIQRIIRRFSSNSLQPSPLSSRPSSISIPTVSPRWKSGLILVCSQCAYEQKGSSYRTDRGSTASEELQNWLKSRLKLEGLWGEFRVVSTSCLGVCPKERIAVVVTRDVDGSSSQCLIIDPQSDRELLYSYIKQRF